MENWQERSINELLRETLKVYLQREEEKAKTKARIMVVVAKESVGIDKEKSELSNEEKPGPVKPWKKYPKDQKGQELGVVFIVERQGILRGIAKYWNLMRLSGENKTSWRKF